MVYYLVYSRPSLTNLQISVGVQVVVIPALEIKDFPCSSSIHQAIYFIGRTISSHKLEADYHQLTSHMMETPRLAYNEIPGLIEKRSGLPDWVVNNPTCSNPSLEHLGQNELKECKRTTDTTTTDATVKGKDGFIVCSLPKVQVHIVNNM